MDSMNADLKQVSETTLPTSCSCCSFDIEVLCASMVSSDIDGAEAYLSDFTKIDSNYESNLMFYLLKRQRVMKLLLEYTEAAREVRPLYTYDGVGGISIPETKDFIDADIARMDHLGRTSRGYMADVVPFANARTNEMHQMMQTLVVTNPDLQKKDILSQMQTLHI